MQAQISPEYAVSSTSSSKGLEAIGLKIKRDFAVEEGERLLGKSTMTAIKDSAMKMGSASSSSSTSSSSSHLNRAKEELRLREEKKDMLGK